MKFLEQFAKMFERFAKTFERFMKITEQFAKAFEWLMKFSERFAKTFKWIVKFPIEIIFPRELSAVAICFEAKKLYRMFKPQELLCGSSKRHADQ